MIDHAEKARELFKQGYNCTQAVLGAFSEETGLDMDIAMRLGASLGGGMGRLQEVCGSVSGMFMVAGLLKAHPVPDSHAANADHYRLIQKLAKEFEKENGSIVCRDLLGLTQKQQASDVDKAVKAYKKRPCIELVYCAAAIAEQMLLQKEKPE